MFIEYINHPEDTLFVGIGNRLRSDDGVGVYICETLKLKTKAKVILAENSFENYIGKINNANAQKVIIVDAVNFNKLPGYYSFLDIQDLSQNTVNTHTISLRQLAGLLKLEKVFVLGIQPLNLNFGTEISETVQSSAKLIIEELITLFNRKTKIAIL